MPETLEQPVCECCGAAGTAEAGVVLCRWCRRWEEDVRAEYTMTVSLAGVRDADQT